MHGCIANFHKEAKCAEAMRKLRDVDNFIAKSIAIGNALALRRLAPLHVAHLPHTYLYHTYTCAPLY
jgi:hypothetical protein